MTNDTFTRMVNHPLIQEQWKPKVGDWTDKGVLVGLNDKVANGFCIYRTMPWHWLSLHKRDLIWHPTQEDLQGVVIDRFKSEFQDDRTAMWRMLSDFERFAQPMSHHGICSIKQLWLAFVMHELHGLRWDEEKWIKKGGIK